MECEVHLRNEHCVVDPYELRSINVEENISYNDFFLNYMYPNVPCVLKNTAKKWESFCSWVKCGKPNFDILMKNYGECEVTIYDCHKKYYNSQETKNDLLKNYINYWEKLEDGNLKELFYLKDWHLKSKFPNDNFYEVPVYFTSDWLNEYFVEFDKSDDYRFVYMGPKGTWTPFHADVFNSFSWSANICGKKKWILFPPGEEYHLRDDLQNLPYDVTSLLHDRKYFEIIQGAGDAIFVPSGWYHQVWNLDETISVNHNWINGCNIHWMWSSMRDNLAAVKKEISDCSDMENFEHHCQIMLNSTYGCDFYRFFQLLEFIANKRINQIKTNIKEIMFNGHTLGPIHTAFDLKSVCEVLKEFAKYDDIFILNYFKHPEKQPENLLRKILRLFESLEL